MVCFIHEIHKLQQLPVTSLQTCRSMLRDESLHPDASSLKPERFMEEDPDKKRLMAPHNCIFGFGS